MVPTFSSNPLPMGSIAFLSLKWHLLLHYFLCIVLLESLFMCFCFTQKSSNAGMSFLNYVQLNKNVSFIRQIYMFSYLTQILHSKRYGYVCVCLYIYLKSTKCLISHNSLHNRNYAPPSLLKVKLSGSHLNLHYSLMVKSSIMNYSCDFSLYFSTVWNRHENM